MQYITRKCEDGYYILKNTEKYSEEERLTYQQLVERINNGEKIIGVSTKTERVIVFATLDEYINHCVTKARLLGKDLSILNFKVSCCNGKPEIGVFGCDKFFNHEVIEIPNFVTCIGTEAFCVNGQYSLSKQCIINFILPENLKIISKYAFAYNTGLKTFKCNANLREIRQCTFANCTELREIQLNEGLRSIGQQAFVFCNSLYSVTLPDTVETIGESCFMYAGIRHIKGGKNLKSLPDSVFGMCKELETADFSTSCIETVGEYAFQGCVSLKEVKLPNTVKCINAFAFGLTTPLKSIKIPNSVEFLGVSALNAIPVIYTNNKYVRERLREDGYSGVVMPLERKKVK